MNLKQTLLNICLTDVNRRMVICEENMRDLQESLASETKSSAGDKHETGRAMIHLEREQLGNQLAIIENQMEVLKRINPLSKNEIVALGSWVKTNQHHYFIAASLGKITCEDLDFFVISNQSPIGKLLLGKRVGDGFNFNSQNIIILETE